MKNAIFIALLSHFLSVLTQFGNLDMKWVSSGNIECFRPKYERKNYDFHWIGLRSHGNGRVIPLIFHVFSKKNEKKIEKKLFF